LDANENPYRGVNRYPDPQQSSVKAVLAEAKSKSNQIVLGNGVVIVLILLF
jgi:histidinol-phosphate aminotransferase